MRLIVQHVLHLCMNGKFIYESSFLNFKTFYKWTFAFKDFVLHFPQISIANELLFFEFHHWKLSLKILFALSTQNSLKISKNLSLECSLKLFPESSDSFHLLPLIACTRTCKRLNVLLTRERQTKDWDEDYGTQICRDKI